LGHNQGKIVRSFCYLHKKRKEGISLLFDDSEVSFISLRAGRDIRVIAGDREWHATPDSVVPCQV
jgi:hypothetical protein